MLRTSLVALRNLRGRRLRNALTAVTVTISTCFVIVFSATEAQTRAVYDEAEKDNLLLILPRLGGATLSLNRLKEVETMPGVEVMVDVASLRSSSPDGRVRFSVIGITDNGWGVTHDEEFFYAPPEMIERWRKAKDAAIAGRATAEAMGWQEGQRVVVPTAAGDVVLQIVGISPRGHNANEVVAHYEYVDAQSGGKQRVRIAVVKGRNQPTLRRLSAEIDRRFSNTDEPTDSLPESVFQQVMMRDGEAMLNLVTLMGSLFLLLSVLVTANAVRLSVTERIGELGTLRALGFKRRTIILNTLLESLLVAMAGSALGVGAMLLLFGGGLELGGWVHASVPLRTNHFLFGLGSGALVGVAAGAIPAVRAANLDVVTAMVEK